MRLAFFFFFLNLFESCPLPLSTMFWGVFFSFVVVDKAGLNGLQSAVIVALESESGSVAGNA